MTQPPIPSLIAVYEPEVEGWKAYADALGYDVDVAAELRRYRLSFIKRAAPAPPPPPAKRYPEGKGFLVWQRENSAHGDPVRFAAKCVEAKVDWVGFKITEREHVYGGDLFPWLRELMEAHVAVWGWGYVYLDDPEAEAVRAAAETKRYGLRGYLIDGEGECKGRGPQAARYAAKLRAEMAHPIGLCSYRYPSLHQDFPWAEFLSVCDFHAPQVYWLLATGDTAPGGQLLRSLADLKARKDLPYVPIGCAFPHRQIDGRVWNPSLAQFNNFNATARQAGLPGVGWWSWQSTEAVPDWWAAIAAQVWAPA